MEKRFAFKMLKYVCNDKKDRFIKVLKSFIQCETNIVVAKRVLEFKKSIDTICRKLIKCKSDFRELVKNDTDTAEMIFLQICEIGSIYLLEYLVDCYSDALNKVKYSTTKRGGNGLHLAVITRHLSVVNFLLKRVYFPNNNLTNPTGRAILDQVAENGKTPVFYATAWEYLEIFKLLVSFN